MNDPIENSRKEVTQRILMANCQGGWEGTHTDFKQEFGSTPRDFGRLMKHILAFANTPRRTDAYLIFGVSENKEQRVFAHTGVPDKGFPAPEKIYDLLQHYTKLRMLLSMLILFSMVRPRPISAFPSNMTVRTLFQNLWLAVVEPRLGRFFADMEAGVFTQQSGIYCACEQTGQHGFLIVAMKKLRHR